MLVQQAIVGFIASSTSLTILMMITRIQVGSWPGLALLVVIMQVGTILGLLAGYMVQRISRKRLIPTTTRFTDGVASERNTTPAVR